MIADKCNYVFYSPNSSVYSQSGLQQAQQQQQQTICWHLNTLKIDILPK